MYGFNHSVSRPVTSELLELAEQGVVDWESLARNALMWLSEHDVAELARVNGYLVEEDEPDVTEAEEWADFDPDC